MDTNLPLYLGGLGLRPCYCPDTILQPSLRNLRCAPSTCVNTAAPARKHHPPHLSTQLTRFSPPTQNSTHASSPSSRAREITLTRKPGKRSRQPSENSELVSFVSVFASFPSPHRKKQCAEANKTPVLLCSPLRPGSQVGNYLWLLGKSVESIGSRMK